MKIKETPLKDCYIIEPTVFEDGRGYFYEKYNEKKFEEFKAKASQNLAYDHAGELVYIAPTRVNLQMAQEKWPDIQFHSTREHGVAV